MAIFKMNTDELTSASSSISSEASSISNVVDSINGYDVSCEDDFDFAGAKASLAANAEACYNKVLNTSKLISACAESHMSLQQQLTQMPNPEAEQEAESTNDGGTPVSAPSNSGSSHSSSDTSWSRPSRRSSSVASAASTATSAVGLTEITDDTTDVPYVDTIMTDEEAEKDLDQLSETTTPATETGTSEQTTEETSTEATTATPVTEQSSGEQTVEEAIPSTTSSTSDTSEVPQVVGTTTAQAATSGGTSSVFTDNDFSYDKDGYAKLGDNYVISCDESIGKVGDQITITSKTGETINCVVGSNSSTPGINVIVNDVTNTGTIPSNFTNNVSSITNGGQSSLIAPMGVSAGGVQSISSVSDNDKLEDVVVNNENSQADGS